MCKDIAIEKALFAKELCAWNENSLLASARIPLNDWKRLRFGHSTLCFGVIRAQILSALSSVT